MALLIERRLRMLSKRLAELRAEMAVADEQLAHFTDDADDARLRALVSETPLADSERRAAERHSDAMGRHRDELIARIHRIEAEQDELLDRLSERRRR
jgi:hypothetical protein